MGWAFFPALFLGLYGFSVHPLIGLVGLVVPFAIAHALKTEREKREKAHQDCEARSAENDRRRRFSQQASEMSSAENDTRRRIAQQASEMRSAENDRLRRIADLGALEGRLRDRLNEKLEELLYTFRLTVRTSPLGVRDYRRFDKEVLRFLEAGIAPGDQTTLIHNNTFLSEVTCPTSQS